VGPNQWWWFTPGDGQPSQAVPLHFWWFFQPGAASEPEVPVTPGITFGEMSLSGVRLGDQSTSGICFGSMTRGNL
jgi:hypothetical protein